MEISLERRAELLGLFGEILDADECTSDLPSASAVVAGCARLQSVLASRDAAFTQVVRRLEAEAAAASRSAEAAETPSVDAAPAQLDLDDIPPPPPVGPRLSLREQRLRDKRASWLAVFEQLAAALSAGQIAAEHVDLLAAICERLPEWVIAELRADEPFLVRAALTFGPEGFAAETNERVEAIRDDRGQSRYQQQLAESRAWMRLDRATGLYHLHAVIDPLRGEALQSALDQRGNQLRADPANRTVAGDQITLSALLDLTSARATVTPRALVVVDDRTACAGQRHEHTVCENIDGVPVPLDYALQACAINANVTAAIVDRAGKPADLSSPQPLATREQRDEIRGLDRECIHPDCHVPFSRCEQHHVTFRRNGGATAVSNLAPVCAKHHHDIHDRGWTLTLDEQRTARWYRPDGTLHAEVLQTRLDRRPTTGDGDDALQDPGRADTGPPGTAAPPNTGPPQPVPTRHTPPAAA